MQYNHTPSIISTYEIVRSGKGIRESLKTLCNVIMFLSLAFTGLIMIGSVIAALLSQ